MRTLPLAARLYLIILWSAAAALIGLTLTHLPFAQPALLPLWLVLFVFGDYFEASVEISEGNHATMTITDAAMIFLVAVTGASGALVAAVGTGVVGLIRRHVWYRNLFNIAQRSVTYLAMLLVYTWVHSPGSLPFGGPRGLATLGAVAAV